MSISQSQRSAGKRYSLQWINMLMYRSQRCSATTSLSLDSYHDTAVCKLALAILSHPLRSYIGLFASIGVMFLGVGGSLMNTGGVISPSYHRSQNF
mmetsp:Transcript_2204/g.6967  ORF Transcript_2204/g.6967 Transcript_2204/m.6967 type:complete len:96 (+) Transcript_2204:163-450(+)